MDKQRIMDEVNNFIEYYSSSDEVRQQMYLALQDYLDEEYEEPNDYARIMQLIPLTTDEIREQGRSYNPSEWDRNIDRMLLRYSDIKWYKRDMNESPHNYEEYYAIFTNSIGIKVINRVSYSASMNSTLWVEVAIDEDNVLHYNHRSIRFKRNNEASKYLAEQTAKYGRIYTTIF